MTDSARPETELQRIIDEMMQLFIARTDGPEGNHVAMVIVGRLVPREDGLEVRSESGALNLTDYGRLMLLKTVADDIAAKMEET